MSYTINNCVSLANALCNNNRRMYIVTVIDEQLMTELTRPEGHDLLSIIGITYNCQFIQIVDTQSCCCTAPFNESTMFKVLKYILKDESKYMLLTSCIK